MDSIKNASSCHRFGAWYVYDSESHTFKYRDGEQLIEGLDPDRANPDAQFQLVIEYPQEVFLVEGNHPELFSANGSHGTWGAEGRWTYFELLFVRLYEECDRGFPISGWENPTYIDRNIDESEFDGTPLQWVNFQGDFGNQERLVRTIFLNSSSARTRHLALSSPEAELHPGVHIRRVRVGGLRGPARASFGAFGRLRGLRRSAGDQTANAHIVPVSSWPSMDYGHLIPNY